MTEQNDKETRPDEANEAAAEAVGTPENGGQAQADLEALTKRAEAAEARAAEFKDGWQRAQADFQNYKKRIERDNELVYATMKGDILQCMGERY
jgi:molecular chaperone GrpE (heat shock protein)